MAEVQFDRIGDVLRFENEQARCISYGGNNQQMSHWLPAGLYEVDHIETIQVSNRGQSESHKCYVLKNIKGHSFYVHPNFLN